MYIHFLRFTFLFLFFVLYTNLGIGQMKAEIRNEVEKIIYYDTEIPQKNIAGYSVGLIYNDSTFIYHFGGVDYKQEISLTDTTVFEVGGLTKVFTASLTEILVQEGLLSYSTPFNEYLDSNFHNPILSDLTIKQLVSHTTGFPKLPYEFGTKEKEPNNPYAHYTKTDLLEFYKNYRPDKEKEMSYFYSGINYALLEVAIEKSTGRKYSELLYEKLFEPLKMQQSFVEPNDKNNQIPTPGFSINQSEVPFLKYQSFAASEGVKSSMHDLLSFVTANINTPHSKLEESLKATHQEISKTEMSKETHIAKGWHVLKLKKYYNVILHSGSTNGHRAFIGFVPETKTGVVVLTNSEHREDGLGFLILRMLNHDWKKKKNKRGRK